MSYTDNDDEDTVFVGGSCRVSMKKVEQVGERRMLNKYGSSDNIVTTNSIAHLNYGLPLHSHLCNDLETKKAVVATNTFGITRKRAL